MYTFLQAINTYLKLTPSDLTRLNHGENTRIRWDPISIVPVEITWIRDPIRLETYTDDYKDHVQNVSTPTVRHQWDCNHDLVYYIRRHCLLELLHLFTNFYNTYRFHYIYSVHITWNIFSSLVFRLNRIMLCLLYGTCCAVSRRAVKTCVTRPEQRSFSSLTVLRHHYHYYYVLLTSGLIDKLF